MSLTGLNGSTSVMETLPSHHFLGSTGPNSDFVPISKHISNNLQWVEIMNKMSKTNEVLGIALTGWSR